MAGLNFVSIMPGELFVIIPSMFLMLELPANSSQDSRRKVLVVNCLFMSCFLSFYISS